MNNRHEDSRLTAGLRALAAEEKQGEAALHVEERLLAAFRARHRVIAVAPRWSVPRQVYWATGACAAAIAIAVAIWRIPLEPALPPLPVPRAAITAPAVPLPVVTAARRTRARVHEVEAPRRTEQARSRPPQTAPVENAFTPLPYAARLGPAEAFEVVRVRMPRAALVRFGVPVRGDLAWEPVKADVVFGEDGMARAIRFVK